MWSSEGIGRIIMSTDADESLAVAERLAEECSQATAEERRTGRGYCGHGSGAPSTAGAPRRNCHPSAVKRFVGVLLLGSSVSLMALTPVSQGAAKAGTGGTPAQRPAFGLCGQPGKAHDVKIAFQSEGQARSAVLHLPGAAGGRALALLVAFHGWGSNGSRFEHETGLDALADRQGFAVLYPSSEGTHWQISGPPTDVTFVTAVLARVEALACIDRRRVYATGVSNGAGMVARLACEASLQFAGVVPVAGRYPPVSCEPSRAVSLLEIHGADDTVAPYSGMGAEGGLAALTFAAAWAARDGCAQQPAMAAFAPHATLYRWNGCEDGARIEQLTLYGVGHGLPGAPGAAMRTRTSNDLRDRGRVVIPRSRGARGASLIAPPIRGGEGRSGGRGSNPRPQAWEACALPTELPPHDAAMSLQIRGFLGSGRLGTELESSFSWYRKAKQCFLIALD